MGMKKNILLLIGLLCLRMFGTMVLGRNVPRQKFENGKMEDDEEKRKIDRIFEEKLEMYLKVLLNDDVDLLKETNLQHRPRDIMKRAVNRQSKYTITQACLFTCIAAGSK